MAVPYPSGRFGEETPAGDLWNWFVEGGQQRGFSVGDPRFKRPASLPTSGDLSAEMKGDRPLGPDGEQPSPDARKSHPGAGLKGEAFQRAIQEATAPGAGARAQAAVPVEGRQPQLAVRGIQPEMRERAFQSTPDPWGVDVSQAGMAQNEIARQAIEGRHINRLQEINAAEAASGGSAQERDVRSKRLDLEATALTQPSRPLYGDGGVFSMDKGGAIQNAPQRGPATPAQRQNAIFQRLSRWGAALERAHATGDAKIIQESEAAYDRMLREAELELSAIAGRPITGSRQSTIDLVAP